MAGGRQFKALLQEAETEGAAQLVTSSSLRSPMLVFVAGRTAGRVGSKVVWVAGPEYDLGAADIVEVYVKNGDTFVKVQPHDTALGPPQIVPSSWVKPHKQARHLVRSKTIPTSELSVTISDLLRGVVFGQPGLRSRPVLLTIVQSPERLDAGFYTDDRGTVTLKQVTVVGTSEVDDALLSMLHSDEALAAIYQKNG
jgi:hypothetical protein